MLTYTDLLKGFEFGPWMILPERDLIRRGEEERHLEPLVMNVFVVLASHGGGVVTRAASAMMPGNRYT
jgi:DNA-binding winged helix-turn-helix (wHTH) protein